ncbi:unnamed protein product [Chrysodeixis includens]|uniref:Cytochrome P450 n=1 Tax=Chrysodeixis includens TaxID=689277 RepID=A0A9N8L087_CHRIL|nr:unnamed protein product [Chrysodeixis includens]
MISVLLLCVIWCACVALAWRAYGKKGTAHPLPPALSGGLPIIGHSLKTIGDTEKIWHILNDMSKECVEKGGVIIAHIGPDLYYLITDPDDALTAANACMQKHFIYDYVKAWLGEGLLTSSGAQWQRHRKLLNPAFTVSVIHGFLGIFNHMSRQMNDEVAEYAGKGPFDHSTYLRLIAFQTFSRTGFGISDSKVKEFARKYMESSDQIMNLVILRFQNIWLQSDLIFKLSGLKKKKDKLIKILDNMANQVIEGKKEEMKNAAKEKRTPEYTVTGTRCKPLMSLLMELKNDDTLTEKEIKEEVDTAIVAGFDTTSNLMTVVFVAIGAYPEIQQKMYEEMIEVLGPDRDVEKDDIKRLVYTEAVIKETLRVYPTGPALLRHVDRDVKLRNYTMRAGSQCVILPLGTHKNLLWGEDFEAFRPERWLDPAVAALGNSAFYGFSKTYAMISMKVTLAHFIRKYRITADVNELRFKVDMLLKATAASIRIDKRE